MRINKKFIKQQKAKISPFMLELGFYSHLIKEDVGTDKAHRLFVAARDAVQAKFKRKAAPTRPAKIQAAVEEKVLEVFKKQYYELRPDGQTFEQWVEENKNV